MLHSLPWWLTLQVLGAAAFPWALFLFRNLPDRGYGLSKVLGLLVAAYGYWAVVNAGRLPNGLLALLVTLAFFLAVSGYIAWRQRDELLLFFRYNRGLILLQEALFTGAFFLFVGFRVLAPDVHLTTALTVTTEQPMDLAFLAGVLQSPSFPPADPWLAGHPISYYYFGYLAFGLPARLAMAAPTTAYSLALASIFALAAVAAFSLAANAATLARLDRRGGGRVGALAVTAGMSAALLLLVAGNLDAIGEVLRRAVGQDGLLSDPNWWWGPSRVIADGTHADPIDEFPAFSLVLGDLHPHVMAIPFVLLVLGIALAWITRPEAPDIRWPLRQPGEMVLIALIVGTLGFINTWDLPTYLGVMIAAMAVRRLREGVGSVREGIGDVLLPGLTIAVLALLFFAPFYFGLDGQAHGILPLGRTGTGFGHYFLIWGPLLAAAAPMALIGGWMRLERRAFSRKTVAVLVGVALLPLLLWTIAVLFWQVLPQESAPTGRDIARRWLLLVPAVVLLFLALVALAPSNWEEEKAPEGRTFGYLLVVAAALTIIVPEVFFVRDLFGTRMNTVFKLHYQAWVLLSVAGGIGLAWLLAQSRPRDPFERLVSAAGFLAVIVLAFLSITYGLTAAATRIRHSPTTSAALDGLAFYRRLYPNEVAAFEWLRRNAPRGSVVLEAVGNDYSDYGRVASITGLPTVIGWEGHELQWRSGFELFASRRGDVTAIYAAEDPATVGRLLRGYDVDYIFVGRLEREAYGLDVAERLGGLFPNAEAFRSGDVVVIRVPPE